ncbi:MAG: integrase arm-type DNA-binding domain-containing protein [Hyphomicrobiales bacterium]|nr:integrase arm-type DNA-binding domain-containing protein [Hyphomicrobiales bacterium]MDE2114303.1 DUF4102 domain-containing protein [Hyphomicrobiales bacterium]
MQKLNAKQLTKMASGRHGDGNGLYFDVKKSRSSSWVLRFMIDGKPRTMGLGGYPAVSLADARETAFRLMRLVKEGIDPLEQAREAREKQQAEVRSIEIEQSMPTFQMVMTDFIEERRPGWANKKHAAQWTATLETYARPILGKKVNDISTTDIKDILM